MQLGGTRTKGELRLRSGEGAFVFVTVSFLTLVLIGRKGVHVTSVILRSLGYE